MLSMDVVLEIEARWGHRISPRVLLRGILANIAEELKKAGHGEQGPLGGTLRFDVAQEPAASPPKSPLEQVGDLFERLKKRWWRR